MKKTYINAFGKKVSREKAIQIIINDYICWIVYAGDSDVLEDILYFGWKALEKWSNKEIEDCISGLSISNQPNGKI
jgi:hypothetical protein